jgi:hypothetical protein
MNRTEWQAQLEARVQAAYDLVPAEYKEDFIEAGVWARDTLRDHEGKGHHFELSAEPDGTLACSFAKPEWPGDHCGKGMPTAAEAIVRAVVEYLNGA